MKFESWGRYPKAVQEARFQYWPSDPLPQVPEGRTLLPYGLGRSYGDSCLNDGQLILVTQPMTRLIHFDRSSGLLRAEAGLSLASLLEIVVPAGWFLPVTPGTQYVTLGGAVANDVHGKNHHGGGTLCHHITQFEVLRSDGQRLVCSPTQNVEMFRATIGGLGLTGLITWVEMRLKKIVNAFIDQEIIQFGGIDEFFALSAESEARFEYTVSWVDGTAQGKSLGRGLFIRGEHSRDPTLGLAPKKGTGPNVPLDAPNCMLNSATIWAFDQLYYHKQFRKVQKGVVHYAPFFYPLDQLRNWNRIYGKRGFLQYQFVIPVTQGIAAVKSILGDIASSGNASFLAVMKTFGPKPSLGMLSFPSPGFTLAMDFAFQGDKTLKLLERLDRQVMEVGGRLYPAKDARMSAPAFQQFYPQWREFLKYKEARFSSSFWRRVTS